MCLSKNLLGRYEIRCIKDNHSDVSNTCKRIFRFELSLIDQLSLSKTRFTEVPETEATSASVEREARVSTAGGERPVQRVFRRRREVLPTHKSKAKPWQKAITCKAQHAATTQLLDSDKQ